MARLTDSSYDIARPTGRCAATGEPILRGQEYIAVLVEGAPGVEQEGLSRLDYSAASWDAGARPGPPQRTFGHWRAVMQEEGGRPRPFIDDEALLDILEQLEGAQETSRLSFRYILTLMLIRKRLLKFEGTVDTGGRKLMRVRRATPAGQPQAELMEVVDPGMDDAAIAAAVEQLGGVMSGENA
jgi:hypothetical protein